MNILVPVDPGPPPGCVVDDHHVRAPIKAAISPPPRAKEIPDGHEEAKADCAADHDPGLRRKENNRDRKSTRVRSRASPNQSGNIPTPTGERNPRWSRRSQSGLRRRPRSRAPAERKQSRSEEHTCPISCEPQSKRQYPHPHGRKKSPMVTKKPKRIAPPTTIPGSGGKKTIDRKSTRLNS